MQLTVAPEANELLSSSDVHRLVVKGRIEGDKLILDESFALGHVDVEADEPDIPRSEHELDMQSDVEQALKEMGVDLSEPGPDGTIEVFYVKDGTDANELPDVFAEFRADGQDPDSPPVTLGFTPILEWD